MPATTSFTRPIWIAFKACFATDEKRRQIVKENELDVYRAASMASYLFRWMGLPLTWIFFLNGTDKHRAGGHRYAPHYKRFFGPYRWRKIKLLEIGIGGYKNSIGGRSITAWRWYFPFGKIVACDIQDKKILETRGVTIYKVDQFSDQDLSRLIESEGAFDIIIDDGSHFSEHQIFTFEKLFPSLKDGGTYVVEDIQTSYWPDWGGRLIGDGGETCMTYFQRLTHYLNACEFTGESPRNPKLEALGDQISTISFHHNLIFIQKELLKKQSNVIVA
ncbi:hypothetical protein [Aestuariivirga sp.]|uniref:hypothetical protein n=1 Tax=Aestuariivirga sp. TaxID=2650926 RepID=UPI0039E2267C